MYLLICSPYSLKSVISLAVKHDLLSPSNFPFCFFTYLFFYCASLIHQNGHFMNFLSPAFLDKNPLKKTKRFQIKLLVLLPIFISSNDSLFTTLTCLDDTGMMLTFFIIIDSYKQYFMIFFYLFYIVFILNLFDRFLSTLVILQFQDNGRITFFGWFE